MSEISQTTRVASTLLLAGAALLLIGNTIHPVDVDASSTSRLELAVAGNWMPIHLVIAAGVLAVVGGLVVLASAIEQPRSAAYARFGVVAAIVGGTALVLVFGALDGYGQAALGAAARETGEADVGAIEAVALTLDIVDSGMTAIGILAFFGVALFSFGAALATGAIVRRWLGWVAIALGVLGMATGTLFSVLGSTPLVINGLFRPLAMAATIYFIVLAVALRRQPVTDGQGVNRSRSTRAATRGAAR